jgi:phage terminase large subunit
VEWTRTDAIWNGAEDEYRKLLTRLQGNDAQIQRFYEGLWISEDNAVYADHLTSHHILEGFQFDYSKMRKIFLGVDYGDANWTAVLVILKDEDGEYAVDAEFKFKREAPSDIVKKLRVGLAKYQKEDWTVYIDPSAGALKRELEKAGVTVINAKNEISNGIATVRNLLSRQELFIRVECEELIREMYGYRYKNPELSDAVLSKDDHFCDALRYAIHTERGL